MTELADRLPDFLREALEVLRPLVSNPLIGGWYPQQELRYEDGQAMLVTHPQPDFSMLAGAATRKLLGTKITEGVVQTATSSSVISSHMVVDPDRERDGECQCTVGLMQQALERYREIEPSLQYTDEACQQLLREVEGYLGADSVPLEVVTLLHNLELLSPVVAVDEGTRVVRLTNEDKTRIWGRLRGGLDKSPYPEHESGWHAAARVTVQWQPGNGSVIDLGATRARELVRALRLLRLGHVMASVSWVEPGDPIARFAPARSGLRDLTWGFGRPLFGSAMRLDEPHGPEVAELLRRIVARREDDVLTFALRRFEGAYERTLREDALVDWWIALEALFGQARSRGEVAYRMALRMARFLETDVTARAQLREKVGRYYDVRSRVVHGNLEVTAQEIDRVAQRTEGLLRRSLVRWVDPDAPRDMDALELA